MDPITQPHITEPKLSRAWELAKCTGLTTVILSPIAISGVPMVILMAVHFGHPHVPVLEGWMWNLWKVWSCLICLLFAWWLLATIYYYLQHKREFLAKINALPVSELEELIRTQPRLLSNIPNHSSKLALIAIRADVNQFFQTSHRYRMTFVEAAIQNQPDLILRLNQVELRYEFRMTKDPIGWQKLWTEWWIIAIRAKPELIKSCPSTILRRDFTLCQLAVKQDPSWISNIIDADLRQRVEVSLKQNRMKKE